VEVEVEDIQVEAVLVLEAEPVVSEQEPPQLILLLPIR
jgi:hypothetical protein